ncbi:MAG: hypothetical protein WBE46_08565 [Dehalococcoidia bacterium]
MKNRYSNMMCSWRCYPYITTGYKDFTYERGQAQGLSMGKRWSLSWMTCGSFATAEFPDNTGYDFN